MTSYEFNPKNLSADDINGIYQFVWDHALDDGWTALVINEPNTRYDLVTNNFGGLDFLLSHTASVDPKNPSNPEKHRDYLRVSHFGRTLYEAREIDHKPTDLIFTHFAMVNNAIVARQARNQHITLDHGKEGLRRLLEEQR